MTDLIEVWWLLPTRNPLMKLAIHLLSFVPSSASIERLFSLMGDTKTNKRNEMKRQKLQDITYIKSDLRWHQAKNGTAQRHLKHHFGNTEPKGNRTNRDQIEDEEIVHTAESGDMSDSESKDEEARGPAGDDDVRKGQSFSRFAQAVCGAAEADSDDEDVGKVVETNPSVGPT